VCQKDVNGPDRSYFSRIIDVTLQPNVMQIVYTAFLILVTIFFKTMKRFVIKQPSLNCKIHK